MTRIEWYQSWNRTSKIINVKTWLYHEAFALQGSDPPTNRFPKTSKSLIKKPSSSGPTTRQLDKGLNFSIEIQLPSLHTFGFSTKMCLLHTFLSSSSKENSTYTLISGTWHVTGSKFYSYVVSDVIFNKLFFYLSTTSI